jgi:hypothetical protein
MIDCGSFFDNIVLAGCGMMVFILFAALVVRIMDEDKGFPWQ